MLVVLARNPSPWTGPTGNNTYLLCGAVPTLIDAGIGHPEHLDEVAGALDGAVLAQVLITHAHDDHVAGVPALVARWPGVRVRRLTPGVPAGAGTLQDGERVDAGNAALTVLWTPGHAPDHCCFFDASAGDLYCGDVIRSGGSIVIAASRGGDLTAYLESLRRLRALAPNRLLPGHGPPIDDPSAALDAYLEHRAGRELQVIDALRAGRRTAAGIASRIYTGLDPAIEAAATDTVLAHLVKLQRDGRIARTDDEWVLV